MKVTCKQTDISRGLSVVSHAVATRSTLPVLANILIATDEQSPAAFGNQFGDRHYLLGASAGGRRRLGDGSGAAADRFYRRSAAGHGGDESASGQLYAECEEYAQRGQHQRDGRGRVPDDSHRRQQRAAVLLDAAMLKEMIGQVAFAAATDEARPVFTGVLAQVTEDKITFAAADSYRLAVRSADLASNGHQVGDILIPARTLTELARILPSEGVVQMVITPNRSQVLFHLENLDLISRLIDGAFPAYQRIMPQSHEMHAVLDTGEFRAAAKSVALFAKDSNNIVTLTIEQGNADGIEPGTAMLQATAEELGDNTSVVNAAVDGKGLRIMFNVRYLTDVLAVIDTPKVVLELESPQKPGVVRPDGTDNYTYVIMPMHTIR